MKIVIVHYISDNDEGICQDSIWTKLRTTCELWPVNSHIRTQKEHDMWCHTHIVLCFCFIFLRRVYPCCQFLCIVHVWLPLRYSLTFICLMFRMLSVSLDCPCLITPSVFSNVYWQRVFRKRLVCTQLDISVFTEDTDLHTRLQNVCPTLLTIKYLNFI